MELLRLSMGTNSRLIGPTYTDVGRMSRLSAYCSRMCAIQPAERAGRKHCGEVLGRNPHGVLNRSRVEVDVRVYTLRLVHLCLDPLCDVMQMHLVVRLAELFGVVPQVRGARVFRTIDTVTEAHDSFLALQHACNVRLNGLCVRYVQDHLHDALIRAAVQGPLE